MMTSPIRGNSKRYQRVLMLFLLLCAGLLALLPGSAQAAGTSSNYIVLYDSGDGLSQKVASEEARGNDVQDVFRSAVKGYVASLDSADVARLRAQDGVLLVEKDKPVEVLSAGTRSGVASSWGLDRIDQRSLPLDNQISTSQNGFGVTAYIIDSGILATHTQFGGRVTAGYDAIGDGQNTNDCNGHGTHVAGTVGGSTYGVAPEVSLVAVRVVNCSGSGSTAGVIAGINWATANHAAGVAAVANMSLRGGYSAALNTATENAIADGITFAVAAGNENANACSYSPASAPNALTVGSTGSPGWGDDRSDDRTYFSNWGSCVDIFAPGGFITSAWIGSTTATDSISGTSMASPHVAGAAALLLSANPSSTPAQVATAIGNAATTGVVSDAGVGSPNRLLYVTPAAVIAAPAGLVATPGDGSASIAFTLGSAITNYEYSTDDGATWTTRSPTSASTPIAIAGLANGTTYQIKLRAINDVGTGSASTAVSVTPAAAPNPPSSLFATPGDGSASIAFIPGYENGAEITNYAYSTDNGGSWTTRSPTSAASPIAITGLSNGTTYQIKLRAINSAGTGSEGFAVNVTPAAAPAAPTSLSAIAGNASASIAFTPGSNNGSAISDYEYSLDGGTNWVSSGTASSPVVITGLTNGTTYSVLLRAVNGAGDGKGAASVPVSVTPATVPAAPTSLVVTPGSGSASIAFTPGSDNGSAITTYEYSLNGGEWRALSSPDNSSPITITGLTNGTTYSVRLRAVNGAGDGKGAASSAVSVKPVAPVVPPAKPAVVWSSSTKEKSVTALITPTTGVTYALTAKSGIKTKTGACKNVTIKQGKANVTRRSCTFKLTNGTWLASITPAKGAVKGTASSKSYSFK